jgi:hypothetical protein
MAVREDQPVDYSGMLQVGFDESDSHGAISAWQSGTDRSEAWRGGRQLA